MKHHSTLNTRSHSKNVFGNSITHNYWKQADFWLACIAAIFFWIFIKLLENNTTEPHQIPVLTTFLFLLIFIFPVLEEIVFRGLIQESIQKLLLNIHYRVLFKWQISHSNILTSIFFSMAHLWAHSALWALATVIPSLIFGYFKDKYQSLLPSILLHIFYNFGFYMLV